MTNSPHSLQKWIYTTGVISIIAAFIGMIGDTLLLYSPEGGYLAGDYQFLIGFSETRLLMGHLLGVLFIPFELVGLYIIYQGLLPAGRKVAFFALVTGIYAGFLGVVYHGTAAFLGHIVNLKMEGTEDILRYFHWLSDPLAALFPIAFFILIGLFIYLVLKKDTRFDTRVIWFNPIFTYLVLLLLYFVVPVVGYFLLPMGFNLSMVIFYLACIKYGNFENRPSDSGAQFAEKKR